MFFFINLYSLVLLFVYFHCLVDSSTDCKILKAREDLTFPVNDETLSVTCHSRQRRE